MLPHWRDAFVTVNNLELHYTRTGDGNKPPLVLLHGFSDNGLCWLPIAQALEEQYDVILPDARGHGLSARVQPNESVDNAADVAGLIMALELDKPIVGGHSMGGLTTSELGARYPHLVRGLILEDPAWIDPLPDEGSHMNPFFEWLVGLDRVPLDDIIARGRVDNPAWSEAELPAWAEAKRQLDKNVFSILDVRKPWRQFVAAFTVPTLLITAETAKGAIVSPKVAREVVSLSPFVQVAAVAHAGHNIRRENYPAFMQAMQAFLSQVVGSNTN